MRTLSLLLAVAASVIAVASLQANGFNTPSNDVRSSRDLRACKVLVQKMELSPSEDTWRNRLRTWKCRDDLSPDSRATAVVLTEAGR